MEFLILRNWFNGTCDLGPSITFLAWIKSKQEMVISEQIKCFSQKFTLTMESRIWYRVLRGSRGALDGTAPEKAGRGEGVTRRNVRATFLRGDCSLAVHTFVTNKRVRTSLWGAFLMCWSPIILEWMGPKKKWKSIVLPSLLLCLTVHSRSRCIQRNHYATQLSIAFHPTHLAENKSCHITALRQ